MTILPRGRLVSAPPIILLIAPIDGFRNIAPMNHLALEIEEALHAMEPDAARNFETAVRAMLSLAKRSDTGEASDFDRLFQEEETLRATMRREGRQFSATDRLTRDELHDRHALR